MYDKFYVFLSVNFYSNTTALIGLGLLQNVTILSMTRERKHTGPPKVLKMLFSGSFGKCLCLGHYYHQVSFTHQRLVLELTDMAESDQQEEQGEDPESAGTTGHTVNLPPVGSPGDSGVMKDWLLVAAGLERIFLIFYAIAFAVVTSVYI